ncbi:hypothetical protein [Anaeromyxobacter diazotrophicus]|nr:hypothetical protein [Anaeromyxobacter diazotrophicus]
MRPRPSTVDLDHRPSTSTSTSMRRKHFALANGSLHEVVGAVDLARAIGALAPEPARRAQALAVRVKHMLRALAR